MTDPSIALQYRPVVTPDFANQYAQAQSIRFQQQNAALQQQAAQRAQESHAQEMTEGAQRIQQGQMAIDQTQAMNDAYKSSVTNDSSTGVPTIDRNARDTSLINAGHGSLVASLHKQDAEFDKATNEAADAKTKLAASHANYAGHLAVQSEASGFDPDTFVALTADAVRNGAVDPAGASQAAQQVRDLQKSDPTGAQARAFVQQTAKKWKAGAPEVQDEITKATTAAAETSRAASAATEANNSTQRTNAELPKLIADGKIATANAAAIANLKPQDFYDALDLTVADKKSPTYAAAKAGIDLALKSPDPVAGATKVLADAKDQLGRTETQVSAVKAEAPTRIAEASAIAKANADIEARKTAQREVVQSQDAVNQAQSVGETIKHLLTAAQGGNATAASQIKVMIPELVNGVQGIKRMSGGQMDQTPGSALDKLQGYIGEITEGQPIPDRVVKELPGVIDTLTDTAVRSHNAGVDSRNQAYGTKFEKIAARPIRARDPQGNLHEAPAGTPLPAGWKLDQ